MKLIKAEITGFGKYRQQTIEFQPHNQLFFGGNEVGKSTLYQFIQAMLFGFPAKRGNKRDYTPKDGTTFGGKLWLELPTSGEIMIERYKNVLRGQAKIHWQEQVVDEKMLQKWLAPLNLTLFQEVYTFQQEQLSQLELLKETELHDALISLGISGSKQLMEARQRYDQTAQKMFKPKGQKLPLNEKLQAWQQLQQKISEKEQQEAKVQNFYQQGKAAEKELANLLTQQTELEAQQTNYKMQQLNWPQYLELQQLTKETNHFLPADGEKLQRFYQKYQQNSQQIAELQKDLAAEEGKQQNSEQFRFYLANQTEINQLLQEKVAAVRITDEFQQQLARQSQLIAQLEELETTYGWELTGPKLLADELAQELAVKKELQQALHEARLKQDWLLEQQPTDEPTIESLPKKTFPTILPYLALGIGAVASLGSFFFPPPLKWFLLVGGIAGVIIGGGLLTRGLSAKSTVMDGTKEPIPQLQLTELQQQITDLTKQLQQNEQRLAEFLPANFTRELTEESLQEYQAAVTRYQRLSRELTELEGKLHQLDEKYGELQQAFVPYQTWLPLADATLVERMELLQRFADEMNELQLASNQQRRVLLSQQLEKAQQKQNALLAETRPLLDSAGINQPAEIPLWQEQMEQTKKRQRRISELQQQLAELFPEPLTAEKLQLQLVAVDNQLTQVQKAIQTTTEEKQRLALTIQQLQADGTLDELRQAASFQQAELMELATEWGANKLAAAFLNDLATEMSDQQLPQLLQSASHYFALLTEGRYQQVRLLHGLLVVGSEQQQFAIYELSTGTKDQLIMALRFGYLALQRNNPLAPVIIDDGWLHYDSQRKKQLAKLLAEFSRDYQVICLSSDQEMLSYYQEYHQPVLQIKEQ